MQFRQVRITARGTSGASKYLNRTLCQLPLPVRDLVRVKVILLGQLRQRLVAFQRRQRHLRLECRCVVPPRPSRHAFAPVMAAAAAAREGKASTYPAVQISGATSLRRAAAGLRRLAQAPRPTEQQRSSSAEKHGSLSVIKATEKPGSGGSVCALPTGSRETDSPRLTAVESATYTRARA